VDGIVEEPADAVLLSQGASIWAKHCFCHEVWCGRSSGVGRAGEAGCARVITDSGALQIARIYAMFPSSALVSRW
jgi:hypothetical protein